ncbi:MAG: VCBS repeat-containing protein, partial [Thermoplasmata archaeon]|nr:VCBS repeat-containing protein [Thermoplasmata archaeon]
CYWPMKTGDFNGDGYIDLLGSTYLDSDPDVPYYSIFEGTSSGWATTDRHDIISGYWVTPEVADVDLDGFDDLLFDVYNGDFEVWYGGASFPTSAGLSKPKDYDWAYDLAVAVPRGNQFNGGSFLTEEIILPQGMRWDIVDLKADIPKNTTVSISIMDGNSRPIPGYKDIMSTNIDLSGIPWDERFIHVKVRMWTELNTTTPVLDTLTVKWMDERVWRDEFFGDAKAERMNNLDVASGWLNKGVFGGDSPQLIFTAIRGNDYYTTVPRVYSDAGGLDYISKAPYEFITHGTSAADTADMNGDGFMDVVFAVKQTGVDTYSTTSPLFLGGPLGMGLQPEHSFPTTGASDVLVEDLDGDGYHDVLFAQEQRSAGDFQVNSTLYMGSADGWSDEPDLEFSTKGASGVIAVDLNGDDLADLVFSCYQDVGTSTDSMVFLQEATGFNGSSPDHTLPTKGARAVAAGDLDGDDLVDLVF